MGTLGLDHDIGAEVTAAETVGMMHAVWARETPDQVAVYNPDGADLRGAQRQRQPHRTDAARSGPEGR